MIFSESVFAFQSQLFKIFINSYHFNQSDEDQEPTTEPTTVDEADVILSLKVRLISAHTPQPSPVPRRRRQEPVSSF